MIAIAVAKAFVTVSDALADGCPLCAEHPAAQVAVTVTLVVAIGVPAMTNPLVGIALLIAATLPLIVHVTTLVTSADVPSVIFAVARNCCCVPAAMRAVEGLIPVMDTTKGADTEMLVFPATEPEVAVIVAVPCAFAVNTPLLLTVA